jgi:hypothetical protein
VYQELRPDGWANISVTKTDYSPLWSEPESFDYAMFLQNTRVYQAPNNCLATIWFLVSIAVSLSLFIAAALKAQSSDKFGPFLSKVWFAIFVPPLFLVSIELLSLCFAPLLFLRIAALAASGISGVAMVAAICLKSYGSIGFAIVTALVGTFYCLFVSQGIEYAQMVVKEIMKRTISRHIIISLVLVLIVVSLLSVFFGFIAWNAALAGWSVIVHVLVIILFWAVIRVAGEVTYQLCASFATDNFFTVGRSDFHDSIDAGTALRRAIFQNFGISCFNGVVLPLVGPWYTCAHLPSRDLEARLEFLPAAIRARVLGIYRPIHKAGVRACVALDAFFAWPERRGSVYSAIFGVPRAEGCRRAAENVAFKYARVLDRLCFIDSLLGFVALALETAIGFLSWAIGGAILDRWHARRLAGAWGFFTAFALFHVTRLAVGGLVDAFFVCYVEGRQKLLDPEFEEYLDAQYVAAIAPRSLTGARGAQAV